MSKDILDFQVVDEVREVVEDRFDFMLEKMDASGDKFLTQMEQGYKDRDAYAVRFASHAMKTCAATMGMVLLFERCGALEGYISETLDDNTELSFGHIGRALQELREVYLISKGALLNYTAKLS